jgi:hypothetical protein
MLSKLEKTSNSMVYTSKQELEMDITLWFQQQIPSHPNKRIRIACHFLSTMNLEFPLNSILEVISVDPNKALSNSAWLVLTRK